MQQLLLLPAATHSPAVAAVLFSRFQSPENMAVG
jgi:hypothetical protein